MTGIDKTLTVRNVKICLSNATGTDWANMVYQAIIAGIADCRSLDALVRHLERGVLKGNLSA